MKSIPFFDDQYPVRTVFTDIADCQNHTSWQSAEGRNALLREYLNASIGQIVYACQTHSNSVLVVTDKNVGDLGRLEEDQILEQVGGFDAMVTALPKTMLCIHTADCLPLFLYDPQNHVAAIAHCGWRGICGRLASNAIGVMAKRFGYHPTHIVAAFGPGICEECYEVGSELKDAFAERFSTDEVESFFRPKRDGKFLLDLRKAAMQDLLSSGIRPENIHDEEICTYESMDYPSCRRVGYRIDPRMQMFSGIALT